MTDRHILFIVENNAAPPDVRVWKEALFAKELGYEVSIISPYDKLNNDNRPIIEGIHIYRHLKTKERSGKWGLIFEYLNAICWEFFLSFKIFVSHPFHIIHAANPPDHLFLVALPFKLFGVKYLFDHHDITPENYVAKFNNKDLLYRLLIFMEKLTYKAANFVIATNESYKKIAIERGRKNENNVIVVRNGPDLSQVPKVDPVPQLRKGYDYLVGYVGVIGQQEGIENLVSMVNYIVKEKNRADIKFIVVGQGPNLASVIKLSELLGLEKYIQFTGYISDKALYEVLKTSDVCINPEYGNEFTDKSTMIKIMEYMTVGKPIVQFYTAEGEYTAGPAAIYIRNNSIEEFANALIELLSDSRRRLEMGDIGRKRIEEIFQWEKQKHGLKEAYRRILLGQ